MRFILLEKVPQITADEIKKWSSASDKIRGQMATDILQRYEQSDAMNLWHPFRKSLKLFGIDPKENPFIHFTDKLVDSVHLSKTDDKLFDILVDMHQQRLIDLNHSYLVDPRLYQRSPEEFQYTVNVFETVLDPSRLNRYFKDTSRISVDQIYDKGFIKPAGNESTGDDISTIFGTVESWSGADSENDKPADHKASSKAKIGPREKERLLKDSAVNSLEDIKNPEVGMRVFVRSGGPTGNTKAYDAMKNNPNLMGAERGYYEYDGNQWVKIASAD